MANTFNVGDTVVLITKRHGDRSSNPYSCVNGVKILGKVTRVKVGSYNSDLYQTALDFDTRVRWATGISNSYNHTDLQLASEYNGIGNNSYNSIW